MTIAYFDCFNGAAGDMLLGSLLDAGLELAALEDVLTGLPLTGYHIEHTRGISHSISGSRVRVLIDEPQPPRDWRTIRAMLEASTLPPRTRRWSLNAFERLARAEGRIHGAPTDEVHFHEVGAVDSIVDTIGVCAGLELLGVERIYASPLPSGNGWIMSQHGRIPVPAPATLALLADAGAPLIPSPARGELVTPTAAALLAELATFVHPPIRLARVGYGLGQKDFGWVNGLRVLLGEALEDQPRHHHEHSHDHSHDHSHNHDHPHTHNHHHESDQNQPSPEELPRSSVNGHRPAPQREEVIELRCNLDDATGEIIAYAIERSLAAGALDAWATPVTMKKGRPGVQLACLTRPADAEAIAALLLRETPTLGVRWSPMQRRAAERAQITVATPWGDVRVKIKLLNDAPTSAAPEYEDCAAVARAHAVPLTAVYAAALASWRSTLHNPSNTDILLKTSS